MEKGISIRRTDALRSVKVLAALGLIASMSALLASCGAEPTPTPIPTATATPVPTATPDEAAPGATPTSPAAPTPVATPTPAKEAWEVEWERIVAGAREEGKLVLIGGGVVGDFREVFKLFQDKFGVEVFASTGSSREIVDRILAERSLGKYTVDFYFGGGSTYQGRLIPNGLLRPVMDHLFLPEVVDPSKWYGGQHQFTDPGQTYVLAYAGYRSVPDLNTYYNTDLVNPDDVQSVWDFLKPEFKGMIDMQAPFVAGSYHNAYVHPQIGPEFLRRIMTEMDGTFFTDARLLVDRLTNGTSALCAFCTDAKSGLDLLRQLGLPIGKFETLKEDSIVKGSNSSMTLAIFDRPPHPNAQKLFANWLVSKEGQEAIHTLVVGTTPFPSIRTDITEWGNTLPEERVDPNAEYLTIDWKVEYTSKVKESLDYAMGIYESSR